MPDRGTLPRLPCLQQPPLWMQLPPLYLQLPPPYRRAPLPDRGTQLHPADLWSQSYTGLSAACRGLAPATKSSERASLSSRRRANSAWARSCSSTCVGRMGCWPRCSWRTDAWAGLWCWISSSRQALGTCGRRWRPSGGRRSPAKRPTTVAGGAGPLRAVGAGAKTGVLGPAAAAPAAQVPVLTPPPVSAARAIPPIDCLS
jgi:hypothetical protein